MPEPPVAPDSTADADGASFSFETGLDELEAVVARLEKGDLPLEEAIELFERGVGLSDRCRKQLEAAETRVEQLVRKNGRIQAEPFRTDSEK